MSRIVIGVLCLCLVALSTVSAEDKIIPGFAPSYSLTPSSWSFPSMKKECLEVVGGYILAENDPTPHQVVHVAEYDPYLAGTNGYNPQAKAWILVAIRGINDWLMLKVDYVEGNTVGADFAATAGEILVDVDVNTPLGHDSINLHWNGVHTGLDGSYGPESSDDPSFVPFRMALKDVMYTDTCGTQDEGDQPVSEKDVVCPKGAIWAGDFCEETAGCIIDNASSVKQAKRACRQFKLARRAANRSRKMVDKLRKQFENQFT